MKLKSIKIENYKSFGEENNILILDDLNTIIGKNESGKSNLIECLSGICLSGINDKLFFQKYNRNTENYPIISVILIPTEDEKIKYKIKGETEIKINDQYDIDIVGGFSDMIEQNINFQNNRKRLNELCSNANDLFSSYEQKNNFNTIIKMINDSQNKMFLNYNFIDSITSKIYNNSDYKELSECLKNCIYYLIEIEELLPNFIEIKNYFLNSKYTRKYLEDENSDKIMLKYLLNCIDMNLEDLMKYWLISNEADKYNFKDKFNNKLNKLINEFNKFYTQEKVEFVATFENDSLNFIVKTTNKYLNLDERSNGLKWYLNMYIQIVSKTACSDIRNYIILMDEPGVYLHVNAQKELLNLFEDFTSKNNQIIYTTHSPFMIYEDKPYRTRLIIKDSNGNSNISNKYYSLPHKMGSKTETLTPLLKAIGMSMSYNILSINNEKENIITEGISDYNYLKGYFCLKKCNTPNIIPSVSVDNINNIASILIGWGCKFKVLLDQDSAGRKQYKVLTNKLVLNPNLIVFADGNKTPIEHTSFSIEDVFSDNDKEKVGINSDDYHIEKAYYSLEALKKIECGELEYDSETLENFDKIIQQLFEE